jgi:hypothetical protein
VTEPHTEPDWITLVDDESEQATRRIDSARAVGHIARRDSPGIWLGTTLGSRTDRWHPRLTRDEPMPLTAVCFYTTGTAYEQEAAELVASCDAVGLGCVTRGLEPRGSWERNCALKAGFVRSMRAELRGPLLWVDADARLARFPTELLTLNADFAMHLLDGWRGFSATVYFDDTPEAARLIERWHERCEAEPDIWDQIHLDLAWEDTAREHDLTTAWLDERFAKIFDRPANIDPVIVHTQASRRHKQDVSDGVRGGEQLPDESVRRARSRSRCRPGPARPARECTVFRHADDSTARWQQSRIDAMASAYHQCRDRDLTRIALVGAGQHTREVALPASTGCAVEIACILDDRAAEIGSVESVPVYPIADCPQTIEALVISSDAHEATLADRCRQMLGDRLPIIEPYRDAAALSGTGSR